MKGWLITSHFVRDGEYLDLLRDFEQAAERTGVDFVRYTNVELAPLLGRRDGLDILPDFALFWCKDIQLARHLEASGIRLFNSAEAIEMSDDKAATVAVLKRAGIAQPRTVMVPRSDEQTRWDGTGFAEAVVGALGLPVVFKQVRGSFGHEVFLAQTVAELTDLLDRFAGRACICQEYIASSHGRDVRVQVVGERVVGAIERYNETGDFRANINSGASYRHWDVTSCQKNIALEACAALGLEFAGVDLMFGKNDEPLVCEVNANAHSIPEMRECCDVDVANEILDYIRWAVFGSALR